MIADAHAHENARVRERVAQVKESPERATTDVYSKCQGCNHVRASERTSEQASEREKERERGRAKEETTERERKKETEREE